MSGDGSDELRKLSADLSKAGFRAQAKGQRALQKAAMDIQAGRKFVPLSIPGP